MKKTFLVAATLVLSTSQLTGCLTSAAIGAADAVGERRSVTGNASDKQIEFRVANAVRGQFPSAHINAEVYAGTVLLTGEVESRNQGAAVEDVVRAVPGVRKVANELGIGSPSTLAARAADTAITAKIKSAFLTDKLLTSGAFSTTTERGTVYLQGRVTNAEGEHAAKVASGISGVRQVVKLFDFLSPSEYIR